MKKWIVLVVVSLLALATYTVAGPYLTVRAIRSAVQARDSDALARQVDSPALRTSIKGQLSDRLVRNAGADMQASPFGAFGLSIATGMLDGVVNAMVTPVGLDAIMEGRKVWENVDRDLSPPTSAASAPPEEPLHGAVCRYESLSRFTATIRQRNGQPVVFVLTRSGVQWRLSDIRLPP